MKYVKVSNGQVVEYPYSILKLRGENPNVSFPSEMSNDLLAEYNVFPVVESTVPETSMFEQLVELNPAFIEGKWKRQYTTGPAKVPEIITRRQCALQLLSLGMITGEEALTMTKDGTPPASIQALFDTLSSDERIRAMIDFAAINYYRSNPLINSIMVANNMSDLEVDQFFIAASNL